MTDLERANNFFKNDVFAMETCGIRIKKLGEYAECMMKLERKHKNALDQVMGGAIFSLADFTLAVALNFEKGSECDHIGHHQFSDDSQRRHAHFKGIAHPRGEETELLQGGRL